jgi:rhodanese-related sulfurtransferase
MMISFRSVLFLTSLTLIVASPCFSSHTDITAQQARDLIDSTKNLIILDVREQFEYCDRGHIPGAVNYPWNSGVLEERYEELMNNKILVVCQSGGRSNQAANFLDSKGYTLVYDMQSGMSAWTWETVSCADSEPKYAGGDGTEADPYQIATAEDLIALGETPEDYDKYFILTADIDLDPNLPGRMVFYEAVIARVILNSDPNSLSVVGAPFRGVFDGNGHTISHLTIDDGTCVGLFGCLESEAEVRNLGVVNVNIAAATSSIGSLVGCNFGIVARCYSTGSISGFSQVGGLIGLNYSGNLIACYSTCIVSGSNSIGGLVGKNGTQYRYDRPSGSVTQCYSAGRVSGTAWGTGGLVGSSDGAITQCYSTAVVSGHTVVGGLVGCNYKTVTECYSTGAVTGLDSVGGLTGILGTAIACFWDIQTSVQSTSVSGTGNTTAEMQMESTFTDAGWDFVGETINGPNDIWWILEGRDYPRLWWQLPTDDFEDGQSEPLWSVFEIEPELAWLEEVNGRLEVNTTGANEDIDAIYVGDGWGLDALKEFSLRVDFHFSKVGIGDGRVNIGVVPSLDPSAMQWAEFEVGAFDEEPFFLYEIRDGDWVEEKVNDRFSDNGTLYFSYDPDKDELYFSSNGYGRDKAMWKVTGLVRGRWQSDSVYVILSGGCEGMALSGEDAWLDNFTVDSGAIVQ